MAITLPEQNGRSFAWVVWAFSIEPKRLDLVAICTSEKEVARQVDNASRLFPGSRIHSEEAPVDHLFGASDLGSVARRECRKRYWAARR